MPPVNYPSDSSQKKILKAFKKVGFTILPPISGKGSHRMVKCQKTKLEITVQHKIYKEVIKSYIKKVEELGYDVDLFISKL
ncbi:MAG: hypothetical protein ABIG10_02305 [bacterium]